MGHCFNNFFLKLNCSREDTYAATLHTHTATFDDMFDALTHLAFPLHTLRIDDFNHVHRDLVESGNLFLKGSTKILCRL